MNTLILFGAKVKINEWYDKNILPWIEARRTKKVYKKYKREERAILSLLLEDRNDKTLLRMLKDTKVKLDRFKKYDYYSKDIIK